MMSTIQKIDELISDIDSGCTFNGCPSWIVSGVLVRLKELRAKSELPGFEVKLTSSFVVLVVTWMITLLPIVMS